MKTYLFPLLLATLALAINSHAQVGAVTPPASLEELTPIPGAKPRNALFILIDDLRYDALSCLGHPFIKTPNIDRIAKNGAIFQNAFVTTSLCSPSRASILTGLYMHHHGVVDNNAQSPGLVFFPQYLQKAGYETAFFGKWHMGGESDDPRPGFNRWVSFKGQGNYLPPNPNYTLNVDGERVKQKGYITDELTDYAMDWLQARDRSKPWFAYVSHKAVHAEFHPAERHKDLYSDAVIAPPATQSEESNRTKPLWVRNQRNSWHGVDFPYHSSLDVAEYYRQYCRTLAAVDESVGRLLDWLEKSGQADNTLVMFMGDNGFLFGEFGLIDKRNAYEPSMRVPLLGQCPGVIPAGSKVRGLVANIDIGPTILEAAGLTTPSHMDGRSFLSLAAGKPDAASNWRKELVYEYYWEYNFPHTPTIFALRTDEYKFIQYHGIWDIDELYDLQSDPGETRNLIFDPTQAERIKDMRQRLGKQLEAEGANQVPFTLKRNMGANLRRSSGSGAAEFPPELQREKNAKE